MSFSPYLSFNGKAREAMTFYATVFGATDLQITTFGDAPPDTYGIDPATKDQVMHSQFTLNGVPLMGADAPPAWYQPQAGVSVMHGTTSVAEARRVFDALSEGATVTMPMDKTFWSAAFGMLKDRFGTSWMITTAPGVDA